MKTYNGKTYSGDLTSILFSYRLALSMIPIHQRDAETYKRSPNMDWLKDSERFEQEAAERCTRLFAEFWQLVEVAGSVHVGSDGYLYLPA